MDDQGTTLQSTGCRCLQQHDGRWGRVGSRLTMVPTEIRPSCVCMKTTRNSVTADICWVTAKVLMTYSRKSGWRTYAVQRAGRGVEAGGTNRK